MDNENQLSDEAISFFNKNWQDVESPYNDVMLLWLIINVPAIAIATYMYIIIQVQHDVIYLYHEYKLYFLSSR